MAISKEALDFALNKAKENTNKKVSKYQKYEEDILYLKEQGFSISKIAKFLEDTYGLKNNTSLTALQSFIKVRENSSDKKFEKIKLLCQDARLKYIPKSKHKEISTVYKVVEYFIKKSTTPLSQ